MAGRIKLSSKAAGLADDSGAVQGKGLVAGSGAGERCPQAAPAKVWVVVVAKPQQERLALYNLTAQAFEAYLPLRLTLNRRTRALVATPFFPGYLFARTSLAQAEWGRIWNTRGVGGVLGNGERPVGVADWAIQRIRDQEESGYIKIGLEADAPPFVRGQAVSVLGDLGIEGVFMERVDAKRALLLVSLLGRDSRLTVDLRKLRSRD